MRTSEQINEVAGAMAEAQGVLRPAVKDADNPAYRSKYADLAAVWESCREALPRFGLAVIQDVTNVDGAIAVTTRITHKSGQWIECGPLEVPLAKADAHGLGSAISYGKRYALSAALGVVAEEDDDGNAASGNKATQVMTRKDLPDPVGEGLFGLAEKSKTDPRVDFEQRQTPDGALVMFRLTEGKKGWKVYARGLLATLITEYRAGIEGWRVQCWGTFSDETFRPKGAERDVTFQVLNLTRLKVGAIDLAEPDGPDEPMTEDEIEQLAALAFPDDMNPPIPVPVTA